MRWHDFCFLNIDLTIAKMKKIILTALLTIISACFATAAEKQTVILVKQLTYANKSQLPDKTIEYDLHQLDFNTKKGDATLIDNIRMLIDSISNEDLNNSYYTLSLSELNNGTARVTIESLQELPLGLKDNAFYGKAGNCIVLRDSSSESLLKRVFTRGKGKAQLVQEYEIVEEIIKRSPALLTATITGNEVTIDVFEVNGNENPQDLYEK